jgi:hypothetical protein
LRVAFRVALPSGASPEQMFVVTAPAPSEAPQMLVARYEPSRQVVVAEAAHLSVFWPVVLDPTGTIDLLVSTIAQVLEVRTQRPAGCADNAALPDGGRAAFVNASWRTGTDPQLWGACPARTTPTSRPR